MTGVTDLCARVQSSDREEEQGRVCPVSLTRSNMGRWPVGVGSRERGREREDGETGAGRRTAVYVLGHVITLTLRR